MGPTHFSGKMWQQRGHKLSDDDMRVSPYDPLEIVLVLLQVCVKLDCHAFSGVLGSIFWTKDQKSRDVEPTVLSPLFVIDHSSTDV